jgi:predicted membrane protein
VDKYIFISLILLVPIFIGLIFDETKRKIGLSLFIILFYWNTSINLNFVSNLINPFSIMTGKDELTFGILIYKITIAYLIYQLIISIRQNTRRK